MTIHKSYEALAADLTSEKILSKTLLGQKEAYMMLADKGRLDLSESKAREAALREELHLAKKLQATTDAIAVMVDWQRDHWIEKCGAIKQRLTVEEQRAAALEIPERMKTEPFTTIDRGSKNYKAGYNAAIAEVAKLNGIKP